MLLGLGAFGGLLPDIDSDHSVPIRISFNLFAFALAFLVMFVFIGRYTVLELAAIWLAVFLAVRYLVLELFVSLTTCTHCWRQYSLPYARRACPAICSTSLTPSPGCTVRSWVLALSSICYWTNYPASIC